MSLQLEAAQVQGFDGWRASNGLLSVTLLPELGAKLSSLYDQRRDREWLWTSPETPYARHAYGTSYVAEADSGGWDECFPTVAACPAPDADVEYPDHGELWSQAWATEVLRDADELSLTARAIGVQRAYTFERVLTLRPDEPTVHLDYRVSNQETAPLSFIWSAHPLFRLTAGLRLTVPPDLHWHPSFAPAQVRWPEVAPYPWPFSVAVEGQQVPLDPLPGPESGVALKLWAEPLPEVWAELADAEASLRFQTVAVGGLPQLALWLNAGGWSGRGGTPYANLALEPCLGQQDSLWEAAQTGRLVRLAPGEARSWSLRLTVGGGHHAD